jgi:hypothetical protein
MFKKTGILLVFSFLAISVQDVYAYIDPSSLTYIIQILVASIAGGLFAFREKVIALYHVLFKGNKKENVDSE